MKSNEQIMSEFHKQDWLYDQRVFSVYVVCVQADNGLLVRLYDDGSFQCHFKTFLILPKKT